MEIQAIREKLRLSGQGDSIFSLALAEAELDENEIEQSLLGVTAAGLTDSGVYQAILEGGKKYILRGRAALDRLTAAIRSTNLPNAAKRELVTQLRRSFVSNHDPLDVKYIVNLGRTWTGQVTVYGVVPEKHRPLFENALQGLDTLPFKVVVSSTPTGANIIIGDARYEDCKLLGGSADLTVIMCLPYERKPQLERLLESTLLDVSRLDGFAQLFAPNCTAHDGC